MHDDRCDSCNAKALKKATFANGLYIQLCGHHMNRHAPAMGESVTITDLESVETPVPVG